MKGIKDYQPQEETKSDHDNSEKQDQEVKEEDLGPAVTFADYENMMIKLEK